VVVFTMHAEPELAVQAFRAGATGYVLKLSPEEELVRAIEGLARPRVPVSADQQGPDQRHD
jgi:DNA-binding NarL/FixJ family response regulator